MTDIYPMHNFTVTPVTSGATVVVHAHVIFPFTVSLNGVGVIVFCRKFKKLLCETLNKIVKILIKSIKKIA